MLNKLNFKNIVNRNSINKLLNTFRYYGPLYTFNKLFKATASYLNNVISSQKNIYNDFVSHTRLSDDELLHQKKTKFKYSPLVSIVVSFDNNNQQYFNEMFSSLCKQSYSNWELCIDDRSTGDYLENSIVDLGNFKNCIKYEKNINYCKAQSLNNAIELSNGDYIAFIEPKDILAPNAIFEVVASLQNMKYDVLYTDEDVINKTLSKRSNPYFKPDWSPYLLRSHNYINNFLVLSKKIIEEVGLFRLNFEGAEYYDLILRCTDKTDKVHHISKILYHCRGINNIFTKFFVNSSHIICAENSAIKSSIERKNVDCFVENLKSSRFYHAHYKLDYNPLLSIIIPNTDNLLNLDTCLSSIYNSCWYKNFEVVVIKNNSKDSNTFKYYNDIKKKFPSLRVVEYSDSLNSSAIKNYGANNANGEYLLFLNNKTKLVSPDSIGELLGLCSQGDVGAVGSKVLYSNNTIKDAGIIVGFSGSVSHAFRYFKSNSPGYKMRAQIIADYSAVSSDCFMTKASIFKKVGGFSENYSCNYYDVDYCLKIRKLGYSVLYNPKSIWCVYDKGVLGKTDIVKEEKKLAEDAERLQISWPMFFETGDPFYNTNFPQDYKPFRLKPFKDSIVKSVDGTRVFNKDGDLYAQVRGWAISSKAKKLHFEIKQDNKNVDFDIKLKCRPDLLEHKIINDKENEAGFEITFKLNNNKNYTIEINDGISFSKIRCNKRSLASGDPSIVYDSKYERWYKKHKASKKELKEQSAMNFQYNPKFSIVVPLYNTPMKYLNYLIKSIENQSYKNWELCLSNGGDNNNKLDTYLTKISKRDNRINYVSSKKQLNISDNTNKAISIASGDYIVFVDHDDMLAPNALFECAKVLNEDDSIELIYTDEDKIDFRNKHHFMPHFKSDFNLDMLRSINYICHMLVVKKSLQERIGLLNSEYDGAQDHDFILRCVEETQHIAHIPKILYHWRSHMNSTAASGENKTYTQNSAIKAISDHYSRVGIDADVLVDSNGFYRSIYKFKVNPLVSIIIANKDHVTDLKKCINSIIYNNTYNNYEVIVVENNSTEKATFDYYKKIVKEFSQVKVVRWMEKGFNFSAINNFGASQAIGDYFLFLNNDTEIVEKNSIKEMLGYCMRSDVGAVGAKLFFHDGTIQHAGVIVGILGVAGHQFANYEHNELGYFGRASMVQDLSAVTAACIMIKKSVFNKVKGFEEKLAVAFNDIDLCLKIRDIDCLIVYTPYAQLNHYESKSRGYEDSPEKSIRFKSEKILFRKKWNKILNRGDEYYNENLSYNDTNYNMRKLC